MKILNNEQHIVTSNRVIIKHVNVDNGGWFKVLLNKFCKMDIK